MNNTKKILIPIVVISLFVITAVAFYFLLGAIALYIAGGVVISLFLAPLFHECGHALFALACGMKVVSFSFLGGDVAGQTDVVLKKYSHVRFKYSFVAIGGPIFSAIYFSLCVVALCLIGKLPDAVTGLIGGGALYGGYLFILNSLPLELSTGKTDMKVFVEQLKNTSVAHVERGLLIIQSQMKNGVSPKNFSFDALFNVPVIAEDEPNFISLLIARYLYYTDKCDDENVMEVSQRLNEVLPYVPDAQYAQVMAMQLYDKCVYFKDHDGAKRIYAEIGHTPLGKDNPFLIRAAAAYLAYVLHDKQKAKELLSSFLEKATLSQFERVTLLRASEAVANLTDENFSDKNTAYGNQTDETKTEYNLTDGNRTDETKAE